MRLVDIGLNALIQGHTGYSSGAAVVGAGALAVLGLAMATSWQNKLIHKLEGVPSFSPYPVGALYREFLDDLNKGVGLGLPGMSRVREGVHWAFGNETVSDDVLMNEFVRWRGCPHGVGEAFLEWTQQHNHDSGAVDTIVHGDPYICRMKPPGPATGRTCYWTGSGHHPGHRFKIVGVDMKSNKLGSDVGPLVRSLLVRHGLQRLAKDLPDNIKLTGSPSGSYEARVPGHLCFIIHPDFQHYGVPSAELLVWE